MELSRPYTALAVLAALALLVSLTTASAVSIGGRAQPSLKGCGLNDRLCLAYPDNCTANNSCTLMVTVRRDPAGSSKYLFEMAAQFHGYVAVALAENTTMGADSVVECVFDAKKKAVQLYQSLNHAKNPETGRRGNGRLPDADQHRGVSLMNGTLANEVISCSFSRDQVTTVGGKTYDLATGSWVLQAAAGDTLHNDTNLSHHMEWVVSGKDKVKLSSGGLVKGSYGRDIRPAGNGSAPATLASYAVLAMAVLSTLSAVRVS